MIINFGAIRHDSDVMIDVDGDELWIDGVIFDFTPLSEGSILPASAINSMWFDGDVKRVNGVINLKLKLPHGANASIERRFPELVFNGEGNVNMMLPDYDEPVEEPVYDELDETVQEDKANEY